MLPNFMNNVLEAATASHVGSWPEAWEVPRKPVLVQRWQGIPDATGPIKHACQCGWPIQGRCSCWGHGVQRVHVARRLVRGRARWHMLLGRSPQHGEKHTPSRDARSCCLGKEAMAEKRIHHVTSTYTGHVKCVCNLASKYLKQEND